jgi:hypothetical protein
VSSKTNKYNRVVALPLEASGANIGEAEEPFRKLVISLANGESVKCSSKGLEFEAVNPPKAAIIDVCIDLDLIGLYVDALASSSRYMRSVSFTRSRRSRFSPGKVITLRMYSGVTGLLRRVVRAI